MRPKLLTTYSKSSRYQRQKNDTFEETILETSSEDVHQKNKTSPALTGSKDNTTIAASYIDTIEQCKRSFNMGNKNDREKLMSVNDDNWETVDILTKSHMSSSELQSINTPGLKKYPQRKPLASLRSDRNSNNINGLGGLGGKRFSENRKSSNQAASTNNVKRKGKSKLSTYTRSVIKIYSDNEKQEPQVTKDVKWNSTICKGGNTIFKDVLDVSPIKKTDRATRANNRKSFTPILEANAKRRSPFRKQNQRITTRAGTPTIPMSLMKLKRQSSAQDKVKDWLMKSPVNVYEPKNMPSIVPEVSSHFIKESESESQTPDSEKVEKNDGSCSDISPIPTEVSNPEIENDTVLTEIITEMQNERKSQRAKQNVKSAKPESSPSHKNNRRPRKKRKRICMPSNWKTKQSPSEKLRKPKPKANLLGKELDVRIKAPEPVNLKIKENGDVSFQKAYNLRKRGAHIPIQDARFGNFTQQTSLKKTIVDRITIDTDSVTSEPQPTMRTGPVSEQSSEIERQPSGKIFEEIIQRDVKVVLKKLDVKDLGLSLKEKNVDSIKDLETRQDDGDRATIHTDNVDDVLLGQVTGGEDVSLGDGGENEVGGSGNGEQTNNIEVDFVIEEPVGKDVIEVLVIEDDEQDKCDGDVDDNELYSKNESPPLPNDLNNLVQSKRKLNFTPKRLIDNITTTENPTKDNVIKQDINKVNNDDQPTIITCCDNQDGTQAATKNQTTFESSDISDFNESLGSYQFNTAKNADANKNSSSEASTCFLQRTCETDSGFIVACDDSKSYVTDCLQASSVGNNSNVSSK